MDNNDADYDAEFPPLIDRITRVRDLSEEETREFCFHIGATLFIPCLSG
jgi:hypothetical protein